jgi:hypothetical protein
VTDVRLTPANIVELTVETVPGRTYRLEFSDGLAGEGWTPGEAKTASSASLFFADPLANRPARFYRIVLLP